MTDGEIKILPNSSHYLAEDNKLPILGPKQQGFLLKFKEEYAAIVVKVTRQILFTSNVLKC